MTSQNRAICVFCGSRDGTEPAYRAIAEEIGKGIAGRGWRLVYGAGDVGLMGAVAQSVQTAGGRGLGVIPVHLMQREVAKRDLSELIVTENMHERKKVMFMNSDAVLVLPGGAGTLDEFFEVLTWAQLGLHAKPIVLLNVDGFWDPLEALVDHVIAKGFAAASLKGHLSVATTVDAAFEALEP